MAATKTYTKEEVIKMLERRRGDRTNTALAAELGVSKSYLGDVLRGFSAIGPAILEPLGLEAVNVTVYRKVAV